MQSFHAGIVEHGAVIDRVKAAGETLLSNTVASEDSKTHHRQQLTELLSCYGHLKLSSSARQSQLSTVSDRLAAFLKLWKPFSDWLAQVELNLITDGPLAVDVATSEKQINAVDVSDIACCRYGMLKKRCLGQKTDNGYWRIFKGGTDFIHFPSFCRKWL